MNNHEHYLVRHGEAATDVSDGTEKLTETGKFQSEAARDYLVAEGLGSKAVLLSSGLERAVETAQIIGQGLGTEVKIVPRLGHSALEVFQEDKSIKAFIQTLDDQFLTQENSGPMVLVTHSPLIQVLTNGGYIDNGVVVKMDPFTQNSPSNYRDRFLQKLKKHRRK